jgi:cyclopropane fatty-acyl-phospholipid synthase-like methyltransferase
MSELPVSFVAHRVAAPSRDEDQIRAFYDEHVVNKVADFVDGNPRVDAAWRTIRDWGPVSPRRILDIGCGFGQISWQMAARWPSARVTGADISPRSIALASKVFSRPNLEYTTAPLDALDSRAGYDLITLIDVYEHIADAERAAFNGQLARLLAPDGIVILTFPTPSHQQRIRAEHPDKLQPIDEDVDMGKVQALTAATGTRLVMFREASIWSTGDYAHAVLTRAASGDRVEPIATAEPGVIDRVIRRLGRFSRGVETGSRDGRLRLIERTLGAGVYRPR